MHAKMKKQIWNVGDPVYFAEFNGSEFKVSEGVITNTPTVALGIHNYFGVNGRKIHPNNLYPDYTTAQSTVNICNERLAGAHKNIATHYFVAMH